MPTSALSSLFDFLDPRNVNEIATRLGEPAQAVSRGLESVTASLISGLAARGSDPSAMSQVYGLISQVPPDLDLSNLTDAACGTGRASSSTSMLLNAGKQLVTHAFGEEQPSVMDAITRFVGLRPALVSTLMGVAAARLVNSLANNVRKEQLTRAQMTDLLLNEGAGVQDLVPPGLQPHSGRPAAITTADMAQRPLSITTVLEPEAGLPRWLWVIPVLLALPLLVWLFNRVNERQAAPNGGKSIENIGTSVTDLGNFVVRRLPGNVELNIPRLGAESKLLEFIQDPTQTVDQASWFDFDRLPFDSDSARLRPESQEQLRNIAAILEAYPDVHIKIGGYTDQAGNAENNLRLSEARAGSVAAELINLGISPDRLEAQGYGDQFPLADNSSGAGRAKNRGVSMRVTQK